MAVLVRWAHDFAAGTIRGAVTKARRREITEKWLGTGENVVRDQSLRQALRNQADNHDGSDVLVCDSDSEDEVDEEGEQEDDDQMDTDDEPPDSDGDRSRFKCFNIYYR